MVRINLGSMSLEELKRFEKDVEKAINAYQVRKRKEALAAAENAAKASGFTLEELLGKKNKRLAFKEMIAKYRHPEKPELAWSGRGRRPRWIVEYLSSGKTLEECAVE